MRCLRLLPILGLAMVALAQDSRGGPAGTLLQDALPPGADLVVHVPNVPQFLQSALDAKFGTAETWRAAFRGQIARWGEAPGDAERLLRGAEGLVRMADGEAVVAAFDVQRPGASGAARTRAALFAFRSRAKERELRAAVEDVIEGGLRVRYPAPPRVEPAMGRPVTALAGDFDGLWIRVEDHLVAVSDQPIALGLFFRGLERVARENKPPEDVAAFRVRVRRGRADAPDRWEGFTFLQREGVSAGAWRVRGAAKAMPQATCVVSFLGDDGDDAPVFPAPVPDEIAERARKMNARPLAVSLLPDGTWTVGGVGVARAEDRGVVGTAAKGGWLRALHEGTLAPPFRIDGSVLAAPLAAVEAADPAIVPPVLEWRPGSEPGEMHGPAWHGPVTFLALRTLRDIVRGTGAVVVPPEPASPVGKPAVTGTAVPGAPPAPPVPEAGVPGGPPPKPGPPLPAPEEEK